MRKDQNIVGVFLAAVLLAGFNCSLFVPALYAVVVNLPPDVSNAHPSTEYLWPVNNKFVPITIEGVTDPEGDRVSISLVTVTCDESTSVASYDKKITKADVYISDDGQLFLKAERDTKGNGRVYEITFIAADDKGELTEGKVQVNVPRSKKGNTYKCIDDRQTYRILSLLSNAAPDVSNAYPSIDSLWPANGDFETITILGVTDPDSDDVKITITNITSDEPAAFSKKDPFNTDAFIAENDMAMVRAERDDHGNGRVYQIAFMAKDSQGNQSAGSIRVNVPLRKGRACIDDGQIHDPLPSAMRFYLNSLELELKKK